MNQIFHIRDDGKLVEMNETRFERETDFQSLLQSYPNLLSINQLDTDEPCRWLEIDREMRLAADENAAGRGALDHLYLDQYAIPTLVEVKRKENTDIRRKVVGQMLDYASFAAVSWSEGELQERFERRCRKNNLDPDAELEAFLQDAQTPDHFWQQATANLQSGRIRMLFVADLIPIELRRIIEFMNEQMSPAEVLGVELKQYHSGDLLTLVPRTVGQTTEATGRKSGSRKSQAAYRSAIDEAVSERGIEELYREISQLFEDALASVNHSNNRATFRHPIERNTPRALICLMPLASTPEQGIKYLAFSTRLAKLCQCSEDDALALLPNVTGKRQPDTRGERILGYFRTKEDAKTFLDSIKNYLN